ncbi:MAG TPA: Asd/ArgC dimerization domain-containing protein [Candidatus Acidoferrales bacterium]|nr:Asd/ArgC dimerization domain-containing protein [Candidatus Acidoferrales bacterium]
MPSGPGKFYRVAIVGASSLLGKELKQVLEDRNFPARDIVLLDESVMAGTLTAAGGEATFIRALEEDSFEGAELAFFAGSAFDAERNWPVAQKSGATVIDLTGALAASDDLAPCAIPSLAPVSASRKGVVGNGSMAYSSASPPVIIACTLAVGLSTFQTRRIPILLFPPVSEEGQAGIEELESQTASLLSFREIVRPVFDAQVAFNLLARYGDESKHSLAKMRGAIARDVARYLSGRVPVPSIQLVQTPVFYGYAFAAYLETEIAVAAESLEEALAGLGVKITPPGEPPRTNVSVAGESDIHLMRMEGDSNIGNAMWIWGIADNLRLAANNAVRIAEELIANPAD